MKKEKLDELEQLKAELAISKKEIKSLTGKLERSRTKISKQKAELKKKRDRDYRSERRTVTITLEPISRHRYKELVVRLSTLLYTRVNCGFRSVVKILEIINDAFEGILGRIPSRNTIENWIKKCGLDIYNHPHHLDKSNDYAMIIDESMMIGSEKLLVTQGIPACHKGTPVKEKDVCILDMSVSSSWDSEGVKDRLFVAANKMGSLPRYVISDNASIMKGGIARALLPYHRDISHSLGMFLERCYKEEEDFRLYTKSMSEAQFKHNMKKIAYLLPPRQRTIARFINLSNWVEWSQKILNVYHRLTPQERMAFAFVTTNASLIDELSEVMECINYIEKNCKHNGLSSETIKQCLENIRRTLFKGNIRMRTLGEAICRFLLEEGELLENEKSAHNNSSDIIESTFGIYKQRKSANKLYGVTAFILFMPTYAKFASKEYNQVKSIKGHLENVRLGQILQWTKDNLTTNLVIKRIETLNATG